MIDPVSLPSVAKNVSKRLENDRPGHLRLALAPVDERDRDFVEAQAGGEALPGGFDEKAVPDHVDRIEVERRKRLASVAFVSGRAIAHWKPQRRARDPVAEPADQTAVEFPIRRRAARHVS